MKIAVLGNYATQFLVKSLKNAVKTYNFKVDWYEADFNAVDSEILNRTSNLFAHKPDCIVWHESYLGLRDFFYEHTQEEQQRFADMRIERLKNHLSIIKEQLPNCKILFPIPLSSNDNVFGNYFSKAKHAWGYQSQKYIWQLVELSHQNASLYLVDGQMVGKETTDWSLVVNAELHFTIDYLNWLSKNIAKTIASFSGQFKKCLILDLDNTLWGGIIGDDGLEGIHLGALGNGKAFTRLQKWVKQLKNRGIILAICSKNNEETAKLPFVEHPDMVLKLDDIAVFIANWNSKADNIQNIQQILNIGYDSMVFVDDNPAEREIVRKNLPEVLVPELPEDPAGYLPFLMELNLFETTSISNNDAERTLQYQEEAKRVQLAHSITNMDEYLTSLQMEAEIGAFKPIDYERIAQLSQRSNQFNLRTIRYDSSAIQDISEDKNRITVAVHLADKFGKYGLISIVIINLNNDKTAFVDTWIMSCRVLKRNVEQFILNYIVDQLREKKITQLLGEYIETPKNKLVVNFYNEMGFTALSNPNNYALDIESFNKINTKIHLK